MLLFLFFFFLGCGKESFYDLDLESQRFSIAYGEKTNEFPQVLYYPVPARIPVCTGTLIHARLGVSVYHCLRGTPPYVTIGGQDINIEKIEFYSEAQGGTGTDFGIIYLQRKVQGIRPAGIIQKIDQSWVNKKVITAVGYGATEKGGYGKKFKVDLTVTSLENDSFWIRGSGGVCRGDSGGPGFDKDTGYLAGIMMGGYGPGPPPGLCTSNNIHLNRIDIHLDFIQEALDKVGCSSDEECPQNYRCVDGGCKFLKEIGESCEKNEECASGLCALYKDQRFCSQSCNWKEPQSCPQGFYCHSSLCKEAFCIPGQAGTKLIGEDCSEAEECQSLYCSTSGYCTYPCEATEDTCPSGYKCQISPGSSCGACLKVKRLGERCTSNQECENICEALACQPEMKRCTQRCEESLCPSGFLCIPEQNICWQERGKSGESCTKSSDCLCNLCILIGERKICTQRCHSNQPCQKGWICIDEVCIPELKRDENKKEPKRDEDKKERSQDTGCTCKFSSSSPGLNDWVFIFLFFWGYILSRNLKFEP